MLVVLAAVAIVGWLVGGTPRNRLPMISLGVLFVILAIARGYYWDIFPRGEGVGWFTYNRVSAIIAFASTASVAAWLNRNPSI